MRFHMQHLHEYNALIYFSFQVDVDIEMRDIEGGAYQEIDTFNIGVPFSSSNLQLVEYKGNRGLATITVSSAIMCIEPVACNTTSVSSQLTSIYMYTN